MGGSQSQERAASSTAVVTPTNTGVHIGSGNHRGTSERSNTSTSEDHTNIFSSMLTTSVEDNLPEQLSMIREQGRGREDEEEEHDSPLMTFHTVFASSLRDIDEGSQTGGGTGSLSGNTRGGEVGREGRERSQNSRGHQEHSSSHRSHHHRHHRHHHHREGSSHDRQSHEGGRRRRRYAPEDVDPSSDPLGMELGISWSALNERLQALQGEGSGRTSSTSSGSSRHVARPHRSRTAGPLFFFRAPERSKCNSK